MWAYCGDCHHWFHCDATRVGYNVHPCCPGCGTAALNADAIPA